MLGGDGGFATARWREPASSDRLPSHRSESPTGYSSAGCSPAEPASASPVTDNSSSILIQRGNQIRCSTFTAAMQFRSRSSCPPPTGGVISTLRAGCHFYLAPTSIQSPSFDAFGGGGRRPSDIRRCRQESVGVLSVDRQKADSHPA